MKMFTIVAKSGITCETTYVFFEDNGISFSAEIDGKIRDCFYHYYELDSIRSNL